MSNAEKQKIKKKTEGDVIRQTTRWNLIKTEWLCILDQTEAETEKSKLLTLEELLKQPVTFDVSKRIVDLNEQWDSVKTFLETLYDVFNSAGIEQAEMEKKLDFDASSNAKRLQTVKSELERLCIVVKERDKMTTSGDVERKSSTSDVAVKALKMDKIQTPKYTGKAEDFASWKERFISLVPPGRESAEVAVLLEQAIPDSKRYLLRGCGNDWEKMLQILQKELAPTRDVVNAITLQLSRIKRISAEDKDGDKRFVQLVETLEKMERDLKAINRISVLANCNTILDIESKLPQIVKMDWFKRKREKSLDEGTDQEKFTDLMSFLTDYKYVAKDGIAEFERAKASNAKTYTALVTGKCMAISSKLHGTDRKAGGTDNNGVKSQIFCLACQDGATNQARYCKL